MGKNERTVESYLNTMVKKAGGYTRKWVSPGIVGVPDRIVFLPGQIWFIEVKTANGTISGKQKREMRRMELMGANVAVVKGKFGVKQWLEEIL